MKVTKTQFTLLIALVFLVSTGASVFGAGQQEAPATGDDYPSDDVMYVIHCSPGCGADIVARTAIKVMEDEGLVPVNIVPENKAGGSGAIARGFIAQQEGNPYYLLGFQPSFLTTPMKNLAQNNTDYTYEDLTIIANLAVDGKVIAVRADSPFETLDDLVQAAQGEAKSVSIGGGAMGGADSVLVQLMGEAAGVDFNYVPFGSGSDAPPALLGGHVDAISTEPAEVLQLLEGERIRLLGVAVDERLEDLPDLPTFKEQGLDVSLTIFRGVAAPASFPPEAIAFWENALEQVTKTDEWKEFVTNNNMSTYFLGSEEFTELVVKEHQQYQRILERMGEI